LGLASNRIRVRWAIAKMLMAEGKLTEARGTLVAVEREYREMKMFGEAGLAGLDLVETLVLLGETAGARAICRGLVDYFAGARLPQQASQALWYLRELGDAPSITPPDVRRVRQSFRELRLFDEPVP